MTVPSFQLKLDRALEHAQSLQGEIDAWVAAKPDPFVVEMDPKPGLPDRQVIRFTRSPEVPIEWSLQVGEALHDLRSSLDHLAYALAVRNVGGPLPDVVARGSEFPIFGDRQWREAERKAKIGSIDQAAQAVIKRLQPNERGKDYAKDPLWRLHELVNFDKHRLLLVAEYVFSGVSLGGGGNYTWSGPMEFRPGRYEPGAVVGVIGKPPRAADPSGPMDVELGLFVNVQFTEGPAKGLRPGRCLTDLHRHIAEKVVPSLAAFL
jgi:hypothetical protein